MEEYDYPTKVCKKCEKEKPIYDYYQHKTYSGKKSCYCIECHSEIAKAYRLKNNGRPLYTNKHSRKNAYNKFPFGKSDI
jgi:hypothetical protein